MFVWRVCVLGVGGGQRVREGTMEGPDLGIYGGNSHRVFNVMVEELKSSI